MLLPLNCPPLPPPLLARSLLNYAITISTGPQVSTHQVRTISTALLCVWWRCGERVQKSNTLHITNRTMHYAMRARATRNTGSKLRRSIDKMCMAKQSIRSSDPYKLNLYNIVYDTIKCIFLQCLVVKSMVRMRFRIATNVDACVDIHTQRTQTYA